MKEELNEEVLIYPLGCDISRLNNILKYGIMCQSEYENKTSNFIENICDSEKKEEITLYNYKDILEDKIEKKVLSFINKSICIVLKNKNYDNKIINKEEIKEILIPKELADEDLKNTEYFDMSNIGYDEIKENCIKFLNFLKEYNYQIDMEKYQNSFEVLKYSFMYKIDENDDDMEEARNYLNEDLGYDAQDVFDNLLNIKDCTLSDAIEYLNKNTINTKLKIFSFYDKIKIKRRNGK